MKPMGDPGFIEFMANRNKKRHFWNRLSDAIFAFFETLWSYRKFRWAVYFFSLLGLVLYLEIFHNKLLIETMYVFMGAVFLLGERVGSFLLSKTFLYMIIGVAVALGLHLLFCIYETLKSIERKL